MIYNPIYRWTSTTEEAAPANSSCTFPVLVIEEINDDTILSNARDIEDLNGNEHCSNKTVFQSELIGGNEALENVHKLGNSSPSTIQTAETTCYKNETVQEPLKLIRTTQTVAQAKQAPSASQNECDSLWMPRTHATSCGPSDPTMIRSAGAMQESHDKLRTYNVRNAKSSFTHSTIAGGKSLEFFPYEAVKCGHRECTTDTTEGDSRSFAESRIATASTCTVPLKRFKRRGAISVTNFSSQLWCEKQFEYELTSGKRRETQGMKNGTARHEELERQDHITVDVEVNTPEDYLGLRLFSSALLLQQLIEKGRCREVWIFGEFNGVCMSGIVDQMEIRDIPPLKEKFIVMTDTKTRRLKTDPSLLQKRTASLQLQLYFYILMQLSSDSFDYDRLLEMYNCNCHVSFAIKELQEFENLLEVIQFFKSIVMNLPTVCDTMEVSYECSGEEFSRCLVPYDEVSLTYTLERLMEWWLGEREATHVPVYESFKCKSCDFLSICGGSPLSESLKAQILKERQHLEYVAEIEKLLHNVGDLQANMINPMGDELATLQYLLDHPETKDLSARSNGGTQRNYVGSDAFPRNENSIKRRGEETPEEMYREMSDLLASTPPKILAQPPSRFYGSYDSITPDSSVINTEVTNQKKQRISEAAAECDILLQQFIREMPHKEDEVEKQGVTSSKSRLIKRTADVTKPADQRDCGGKNRRRWDSSAPESQRHTYCNKKCTPFRSIPFA